MIENHSELQLIRHVRVHSGSYADPILRDYPDNSNLPTKRLKDFFTGSRVDSSSLGRWVRTDPGVVVIRDLDRNETGAWVDTRMLFAGPNEITLANKSSTRLPDLANSRNSNRIDSDHLENVWRARWVIGKGLLPVNEVNIYGSYQDGHFPIDDLLVIDMGLKGELNLQELLEKAELLHYVNLELPTTEPVLEPPVLVQAGLF